MTWLHRNRLRLQHRHYGATRIAPFVVCVLDYTRDRNHEQDEDDEHEQDQLEFAEEQGVLVAVLRIVLQDVLVPLRHLSDVVIVQDVLDVVQVDVVPVLCLHV